MSSTAPSTAEAPVVIRRRLARTLSETRAFRLANGITLDQATHAAGLSLARGSMLERFGGPEADLERLRRGVLKAAGGRP